MDAKKAVEQLQMTSKLSALGCIAMMGLWTTSCNTSDATFEHAHCSSAEAYTLSTEDEAEVSLHRHPADGPPVLLVHGVSANHRSWDLTQDRSLGVALQEAGFDAWLLDLRGHGSSPKPDGNWSMDDYGQYDVPAAIAFIQEKTGFSRVAYVGHSMGGMVGIIYQAIHGDDALFSMVIVGTPVEFSDRDPLIRASRAALVAGGAFSTVHTPPMARFAASMRSLPLNADTLLFNPDNMTSDARAQMYQEVVSPMYRGEITHIRRVVRDATLVSLDGSIDYVQTLAQLQTPLLVMAGAADKIGPPDRVKPIFEMAGSPTKSFVLAGIEGEFGIDYGHLDLQMGDQASTEIYPAIIEWIDAESSSMTLIQ